MFSQNQVQTLMIGKDGVAVTASAVKPSGLAVGEIGAFTRGGPKILGSSVSAGMVFVLYKEMADGTLLKSEILSTANVEKVIRKVGTAAVNKVQYFGSNGTAGSIEALDENFYRLKIEMKEGYTTNNHGTSMVKHAIYESDGSATQYEIASGLASSGFSNFSREPKNSSSQAPIVFKAICDNAGVANAITAGAEWTHLTFVQGSKLVTGTISGATSGCLGTDELIDTIVAGDFLRSGTPTTGDVYKIVAVNAGTTTTPLTIELDKPYRGATANIAAASTEYITAALGAAANWGICLTGQTQDFSVGKKANIIVDWDYSLENFGATSDVASANTAANPGINTYRQMQELEWFLQGNEGLYMRKGYPMVDDPRAELEDFTYETIDIVFRDTLDNTISRTSNRKVLTIAVTDTTPGTFWEDNTDGLAVMLETALTGVPVYGAADGTANGGAMNAGCLD
jgi:hypothetical protein